MSTKNMKKLKEIEKKILGAKEVIKLKNEEINQLDKELNKVVADEIQVQAKSSNLGLSDFVEMLQELIPSNKI